MVESNNITAHHSIQSKRLPCSQSTGVSSWSLLSSVDLFSAAYGSNWYGCRPYFLLASSGRVLSSSKSLLSQDKCRHGNRSLIAVFQMTHKWRNKPDRTGSCSSVDYRWTFQYFMVDVERTRARACLRVFFIGTVCARDPVCVCVCVCVARDLVCACVLPCSVSKCS